MKLHHLWYEIAGWVGGLLLLGAFALYTNDHSFGSSAAYQAMNLVGSIGIFVVSFHKKAWQPAVLNVIWAVFALYATYAYLLQPAV